MKREDVQTLLVLAAVAGAVALAWKLYTDLKAAGTKLLSAPGDFGASLGLSLYDWINPGAGVGENVYYTVTFRDGSRHAVPSGTVASDGSFVYGGNSYVLKLDATGNRYAVGVESVSVPG